MTEKFEVILKEQAQLLLDSLEDGDVGSAVRQLLNINNAREDSLYRQIGKITRGLHNTISKLDTGNPEMEARSDGRDVNSRLHYVIKLTQDAANKTMDLADEATPIAAELGSESTKLRAEWRKLASRQISAEDFRHLYKRMDDFLAYSEQKSSQLHGNLTDIVVAQGYQDLSGQVLHKIVSALESTETDLVDLLKISNKIRDVSGIEFEEQTVSDEPASDEKELLAEGPLPGEASTLKNQDDVDALLSDLGF